LGSHHSSSIANHDPSTSHICLEPFRLQDPNHATIPPNPPPTAPSSTHSLADIPLAGDCQQGSILLPLIGPEVFPMISQRSSW